MLKVHAHTLTLTHQHRQDGHLTNAIYFLFTLRTKKQLKMFKNIPHILKRGGGGELRMVVLHFSRVVKQKNLQT